tara:strand:+ start:456 stop:950 length:495 start_codon:yes stop_codon:yes gene_type:complete
VLQGHKVLQVLMGLTELQVQLALQELLVLQVQQEQRVRRVQQVQTALMVQTALLDLKGQRAQQGLRDPLVPLALQALLVLTVLMEQTGPPQRLLSAQFQQALSVLPSLSPTAAVRLLLFSTLQYPEARLGLPVHKAQRVQVFQPVERAASFYRKQAAPTTTPVG